MDETINLDDKNVYQTDLTVEDAKDLFIRLSGEFEDFRSELLEAIDTVADGGEIARVVITIVKGGIK